MMKNFILILGVTLFVSVNAQDNQSYSFTLEEAREHALENNLEIKNAKLDIKAAKKKVWETTAIGLPQVEASANYQYIPGDIPTVDFGGQMDSLFSYLFRSLSALGYPPSGELTGGEDEGGGSAIAVQNSVTYSATLSQLIFNGEYIVGLQAARTYLQISETAGEKTELTVKKNTSLAYYSILTLEKNLQNLDSTLVEVKRLKDQSEKLKEQGFIEDTDVKQLQLNYNNVLNARNTLKRQIDLSYLLFNMQIGLDVNAKVKLTDDLESLIIKVNKFDYDTSSFDINKNIDYQIQEVNEKVYELSLKRVKSTFLPTLSAFYQYQDKTEKADFDFTINHIIGAQLSVPIFSSGMRYAKVAQARIELEQTRNNKELLKESIIISARESLNGYNNALDNYLTEKLNVEISEEIYRNTKIKFNNGMASSMDLTQANTQYLESYSNYITSIMQLLSAKTNLDKIYNEL